jgi:hypothetical protein
MYSIRKFSAKSNRRKGFLIFEEMRKYLVIYGRTLHNIFFSFFKVLHSSIASFHVHPSLYFEPRQLLNFELDAAFCDFDSDPDPTS